MRPEDITNLVDKVLHTDWDEGVVEAFGFGTLSGFDARENGFGHVKCGLGMLEADESSVHKAIKR